jgi:hypothetical protein
VRTFYFESKTSPGAKPYKATRHTDGSVVCSCLGFRHPNKCWHVKEVKKQYPLSDERWAEALLFMRENRHQELLQLLQEEYPALTREEVGPLIKALCSWVCPLCNAELQAPLNAGCTKCGDE